MASKLYGVDATIIIFVFVLYCIVLYPSKRHTLLVDSFPSILSFFKMTKKSLFSIPGPLLRFQSFFESLALQSNNRKHTKDENQFVLVMHNLSYHAMAYLNTPFRANGKFNISTKDFYVLTKSPCFQEREKLKNIPSV